MPAPSLETLRADVRERLGDRAFAHCEAVERTAAQLAATYGVDVGLASTAGLLHDWAREDGHRSLLDQAGEAGIPTGPVDVSVPYLLHAPAGAAALSQVYPGLAEEIIQAVGRHTTGAADMSELDMIVYVADMIEPAREFPGVAELRAAVGDVDLFELYARCYQASLMHLVRRRKHLHPDTLTAWNAIVDAGRRDGETS